jgi:NADH-quinone oxidoreductase subunit C
MSVAVEEIFNQIRKALPDAGVTYCENPAPAEQHSILVESESAVDVFTYLRDTQGLEFDYLSNVSGVDFPDGALAKAIAIAKAEGDSEESEGGEEKKATGGFLEVVYHLYSMARKTSEPLVLRQRTQDRAENNAVASVTSVFRSAEFQEREAFDLFGIDFTDHPDLRRILMWDEFEDFPMRKDYVNPDDYEYEPTPHATVLKRAETHYPQPENQETETQD